MVPPPVSPALKGCTFRCAAKFHTDNGFSRRGSIRATERLFRNLFRHALATQYSRVADSFTCESKVKL